MSSAINNSNTVIFMGCQSNTEEQELKKIELAARTCYRSEHRINPDGTSAVSMFYNLLKNQHFSVLRFGERSIYISEVGAEFFKKILCRHRQIQYWRIGDSTNNKVIMTANLQSWISLAKILVYELKTYGSHHSHYANMYEYNISCAINTIISIFRDWTNTLHALFREFDSIINYCVNDNIYDWEDISAKELQNNPVFKPYLRYCFRIITDRGITHEIVRHTTLSYAQESTRYVSHNNGEVNKLLFIPEHLENHPAFDKNNTNSFQKCMENCLSYYNYWKTLEGDNNLCSSDARNFLPHCLKAEIVVSGYLDSSEISPDLNQGFSHFIDMRTDKTAHKSIQQIAQSIAYHLGYFKEEQNNEKTEQRGNFRY